MEEWRNIQGYEGYQVSNTGIVRNISKGNILKQYNRSRNKLYKAVCIDRKMISVHRLVAQAFIPNPNNLPMVNHKDENPSNNCVENLEWCTQKYNMNWNGVMKKVGLKLRKTEEEKKYNRKKYEEAHKEERRRYMQEYHRKHYIPKRASPKPPGTRTKKKVSQYTIEGIHIKDYDSIAEAYNDTGIRHIGCVCNGSRNSAGGYIWKWTK